MRGGGGRRRLSLLFMMVKSSKSNYPKHEDIRVGWLCCTGKVKTTAFCLFQLPAWVWGTWWTPGSPCPPGWRRAGRCPIGSLYTHSQELRYTIPVPRAMCTSRYSSQWTHVKTCFLLLHIFSYKQIYKIVASVKLKFFNPHHDLFMTTFFPFRVKNSLLKIWLDPCWALVHVAVEQM